MNQLRLTEIVKNALEEDLGRGDVTTSAIVPVGARGRAEIISRSPGVMAGMPAAGLAFRLLDPKMQIQALVPEGGAIGPGQCLARLEGLAGALLSGERVALNFLQRLGGVATAAAQAVQAVAGAGVRLVDTRKTTPGLRMLEKYAVRMGGAQNHRTGLDDAVLIKENHLEMAGSVARAVELAQKRVGPLMKIEVEAEDLEQVAQAVEAGADVVMLDNMQQDEMRRAVELVAGRALVEASGNVNLNNVARVAATGVDFISLGWLTHSALPLDLSMRIHRETGRPGKKGSVEND